MTTLEELSARVAKATGPDRELDRLIADYFGAVPKLLWFATGLSERDGKEVWLGETMEGGGPWPQWGPKAWRQTFRSEAAITAYLKHAMDAWLHPAKDGATIVSERVDVAPAYTANINSVVGLVKRERPTWDIVLTIRASLQHIAVIEEPTSFDKPYTARFQWLAPTPELALLSALIAALQSEARARSTRG